jgi:hypothetical protein
MVVEDVALDLDPPHRREVFRHLCRAIHASMRIYVHNAAREPQLRHGDGPHDQRAVPRGVYQVIIIAIPTTPLLLGLEGLFFCAGPGLRIAAAVCMILACI